MSAAIRAMLYLVEGLRDVIVPFLLVGGGLLLLLLVLLLVQRLARDAAFQRRRRIMARHRSLVDAVLEPELPEGTLERLAVIPARHIPVVAALLLAPLRVVTGTLVERLREAARRMGLIDRWLSELGHRRWWRRAEAARALGLMREPSAVDRLIAALDDDHEEVRAAAVDALGMSGDRRAIPALLSRVQDQSRHQRARIVEALRQFGEAGTPALIESARADPRSLSTVAELLGLIGGAEATPDLIAWTPHEDPAVRAAALQSLGTIGLDDRSYYYALRALGDEAADVRAMAARALGRSGRSEAAPYLAQRLDDEWLVAAQSATALRDLGEAGRAELLARAEGTEPAAELARQMLWEREQHRPLAGA